MASNYVVKPHTGEILATGVAFEEYLQRFDGIHCELVEGNVIKSSPPSLGHQNIKLYLMSLIKMYFDLKPLGIVIPLFVQRLTSLYAIREPDLLLVLNANMSRLKDAYLDGPADICIEISSLGTEASDRGKKFLEYEKGGVTEYWLFDPRRFEALFYRLNAEGLYVPQQVDAQGNYRTPLLPNFVLHVPTLWQTPLPGLSVIVSTVQDMLK